MGDVDTVAIDKLIADFEASGGSELANAQLFVERLTGALGIEQPSPAREDTRLNDYVFERNVTFRHAGGTTTTGGSTATSAIASSGKPNSPPSARRPARANSLS